MPAVRTRPRDVIIRVPKAEPYSAEHLKQQQQQQQQQQSTDAVSVTTAANGTTTVTPSSSSSASTAQQQQPLVGVPLDGGSKSASVTAPEKTTDPATAIAAASSLAQGGESQPASTLAADAHAATAAAARDGKSGSGGEGKGDDATAEKQDEGEGKKNAPTLSLVLAGREESEAVPLSKASTSSAEWNSLLIWARRQRGPQWDSATAVWQVDKYSEEYYSFCNDPSQSTHHQSGQSSSSGPGANNGDGTASAAQEPQAPGGADGGEAGSAQAQRHQNGDEGDDDDRGPLPRSARNGTAAAGGAGKEESPPPVAHGRSARLLRR